MGMFCYQCQEAAKNVGCEIRGVCGKNEEVANLQDVLMYTLKGLSSAVIQSGIQVEDLKEINHEMVRSLFMTITNANFDGDAIEAQSRKMVDIRDRFIEETNLN